MESCGYALPGSGEHDPRMDISAKYDTLKSMIKTVAIIGASNDRSKYGNKAVRAFRQQGFIVYPVHPKDLRVENIPAYRSILDVPGRPTKISVYVPPSVVLKLLPDIASKGCEEFWLNPGSESPEVMVEAERLGLNVIQACSIVAIGQDPHQMD